MSTPFCKCGHSHERRYDWAPEMGGPHMRHDTVCPRYPDGCSCWQYVALKTKMPVQPTICRSCGADTTTAFLDNGDLIGMRGFHQAECMSVDIPMPTDHPRQAFWAQYVTPESPR